MKKITIIDYNMGNITSIINMLNNFHNIKVELSNDPKTIIESDKLILPGVGAFGNAINNIDALRIKESISAFVEKGNSLLGICLGMQLLMDSSQEFGHYKGLGLIPGEVIKISDDETTILPNVGFYRLLDRTNHQSKKEIEYNNWFYFIHSFMCIPKNPYHISSIIKYNDQTIVSSLRKDNVQGCQFHPEKSHQAGMEFFKNFIDE